MNSLLRGTVAVLLILSLTHGDALCADLRIGEKEYAARREACATLLGADAVAVLKAADMRMRSNDVNYRYRQESNFLYLTGVRVPGCILLIVPGGIPVGDVRMRSLLFVPEDLPAEDRPSWPGQAEGIVGLKRFESIFRTSLEGRATVYVSAPDIPFVNDWLNGRPLFLEKEVRSRFEEEHPGERVKNVSAVLARLREIKSPAEIDLIRRAIAVTGDGLRLAMQNCRPGVLEYELQAAVEYGITCGGGEYTSFPSIIGSGPNSLDLHYERNRRMMQEGDVVVMDVGAEFGGYAADVTRTIPASGSWTDAQRRLYRVLLQTQSEVIKLIKAGLRFRALDARAREVITAAGYGRYIRHPVSHQLGIDVHDVSFSDTLKAGMVITVEPGIYIPDRDSSVEQGLRGVGIRIEDDVEVTDDGCTVLSRDIPKDPEEIERAMAH